MFFFWHFSVPYPGIHHDERSFLFKPAFKNHNKHSISWNRKKPHEIAEKAFKPLLSWKVFSGTSPPNAKCPQGNTALNEPSLSPNSPVIRPAIYLGISVVSHKKLSSVNSQPKLLSYLVGEDLLTEKSHMLIMQITRREPPKRSAKGISDPGGRFHPFGANGGASAVCECGVFGHQR